MPKVKLTIDQILTAAGLEGKTGQYNIVVTSFVKENLPSEIEVSVSADQISLDPAGEEDATTASGADNGSDESSSDEDTSSGDGVATATAA